MKKWGLTLLFIGIFSFIMPLLGLQFRIMNIFGGRQEVSFLFIGAGVILYLASLLKDRRPSVKESSPQPPLKRAEVERQEVPCSACGGKNATGDLFCGTCGVALTSITPPSTRPCGHCGTPISAEERFCGECGRPVSEKPRPAQVLQPALAPEIPADPPPSVPLPPSATQEVICSACGGKNAAGDLFCGTCGVTLSSSTSPRAPTCEHCGASIPAEERFCGECGRPVIEQARPTTEPAVSAEALQKVPQKRKTGLLLGAAAVAALLVGIGVYQMVMKKPGDVQDSAVQTDTKERGGSAMEPAERPAGAQEESTPSPSPESSPVVVVVSPSQPAVLPAPSAPEAALPPIPLPAPAPSAPPTPIAPSLSHPPSAPKDPMLEKELRGAIAIYESGQYDIAIKKLETILKKDSENQKAKDYLKLAREQKQKAYEQFKRNFEESQHAGGRKD